MPIAVACACGAKLKAPDSTAGKRVKCPKCGDPITVPAAEAEYEVVEDSPPTPAKKKPQLVEDDDDPPRPTMKQTKAPVEVDEAVDDDDEDEEEDEKPKKKKGKRKTGKNREEEKKKRTLTLILGLCGAVIVLGAAGGVIAFAVNMKDPSKVPPPTQPAAPSLPSGWTMFNGDGFSVAVPEAAGFKKVDQPNAGGVGGPPGAAGGNVYTNATPGQQQQPAWVYMVAAGPIPEAQLNAFRQDPNAAWDQLKKVFSLGGGKVEMTPITVAGTEGREFVIGNDAQKQYGIIRIVVKDNRQSLWGVMTQKQPPATDDSNVKPFFDTFKFE